MIQFHTQMKEKVQEICSVCSFPSKVQKIYSTSRYVCIGLYGKGKGCVLYFGRGKGFEGPWVGENFPAPFLRKRDKFLSYLRSHLGSTRITGIVLSDSARILYLFYEAQGRTGVMGFYWAARSLYFLNCVEGKIFLSWLNKEINFDFPRAIQESTETLDEYFFQARSPLKLEPQKKLREPPVIDFLLQEEEQATQSTKIVSKKIDKLRKKIQKIDQDMGKNSAYVAIKSWTKDAPDLSGLEKIVLSGIEFKFGKDLSHHRKLGLIHEKIKKLRAGNEILQQRLSSVQNELKFAEVSTAKVVNDLEIIAPVWSEQKTESAEGSLAKGPQKIEGVDFWLLPDGTKLAIGKTARANDWIRIQWATKEDLWFHLEGYKGSHLVAKVSSFEKLTTDDLGLISSLLADYSGLSTGLIPILYTKVRFLRAVKGAPGLVRYSKEKFLHIPYLPDWKKRLASS